MPKIEHLQPPSISNPGGYSHVVTVEAAKLIFISGQVAYDDNFQLVGDGDLASQARQVMVNLQLALKAAGASFDDVLKFTIFVVDFKPAHRKIIMAVRDEFISQDRPPASTLLGVQSLARPELLIEIEAIAAV